MRTTRKAKGILNRMLDNRTLTPEGLSWLTLATDPFHDSEVSCSGYPDINTSRSLVQTFTQTTVVSAAAGRADPTKPWNCLTFFNPVTPAQQDNISAYCQFKDTYFDYNGFVVGRDTRADAPYFFSGVNAVFSEGGLDTVGTLPTTGLAMPINLNSGPFRLIAAGYEVVNTTADLYKQGSVTVFKSPAATSKMVVNTGVPGGTVIGSYAEFAGGLPTTQSDAALYPNSRTWEAKEGAYVVCTLNNTPGYNLPVVNSLAGLENSYNTSISSAAWMQDTRRDDHEIANGSAVLLPYDLSGAYFTGLHPQTTLQVTARYIFERIPNIAERDLLVLTRVPAGYDGLAMELYSRVLSEMPVACMVKDNPLGEWFADMLSVLGDVAPMIGQAIPLPLAGTIGGAVGAASKAAAQNLRRANVPKSPQAPKQKQPQNPPGTGKRAQKKKAAAKAAGKQ